MLRDQSSISVLLEDAGVLSAATKLACDRLKVATHGDRDRIAECVRWLAHRGYARHSDGTLDAGVLADAAIIAGGLSMSPAAGHRLVARDTTLALA